MPGPTVIVGCKLPNGLIISVPGSDAKVTLNGSNTTPIAGGYGLTPNVDAAFFEAWLKLNRDSPLVRRGIVFKQEKEVNAKAQAADTKEVETGLEPMAPGTPIAGVNQAVPLDPGQKIEQELRPGEKPTAIGPKVQLNPGA